MAGRNVLITEQPASLALPERLRLGTRELHRQAEHTGFMAELLAGRVQRHTYCVLLRNLHAIYAALEAALQQQTHDAVAPFKAGALHRCHALALDLHVLHGEKWAHDLPLLPAAQTYAQRLHALSAPGAHALVAHAYVRYLGDLHGGQVVRRQVARSLCLTGDEGTRFYDFGSVDEVLALRLMLRTGLAQWPAGPDEIDLIVAEACWAFEQHHALFEQLQPPA